MCTLLALCINLLLPFIAYALQLWASGWNWRDRWASLRTMATPGIVFVSCLVIFALLDHAQFWIISALIGNLQATWGAHLPGNLSLSPFDPHALVARLVLLLPLAPGLAILYEYIAPRTRTQPRRILLQTDMVAPPIAPPASVAPDQAPGPKPEPVAPGQTSGEQPAPPPAQKTTTTAKQQQPLHRKKQQPSAQASASTVEQMTIDSFLTPDEPPATPAHQKPAETQAPAKTSQHQKQKSSPEEPTDWDNVLE